MNNKFPWLPLTLGLALLLMQGCSMHSILPFSDTESHSHGEYPAAYASAESMQGAVEVAMATDADMGNIHMPSSSMDMSTDTDMDSVPDACDSCPGTPRAMGVDERGCPLPAQNPMYVHFALNSNMPLPESRAQMEAVARLLEANPHLGVLVQGHTDATGSAQANQQLSEERAASVARMLSRAYGVDPARMRSRGMGETSPLADNNTFAGRRENRRVELVVVDLGRAVILAEQRRAGMPQVAEADSQALEPNMPEEELLAAETSLPVEEQAPDMTEAGSQSDVEASETPLAPHMTHSLMIRPLEPEPLETVSQAAPVQELAPHMTRSLMIRLDMGEVEDEAPALPESAQAPAPAPGDMDTAQELVVQLRAPGPSRPLSAMSVSAPALGSLLLRQGPEPAFADSTL